MRVFSFFVTSGDLHSHDDLVGVNFFDGAFFVRPVDVHVIARFQHFWSLFKSYIRVTSLAAAPCYSHTAGVEWL